MLSLETFPKIDAHFHATYYDSILSTDRPCESQEILDTFKGIALPEEVLHKIYFDNAKKIYSRVKF